MQTGSNVIAFALFIVHRWRYRISACSYLRDIITHFELLSNNTLKRLLLCSQVNTNQAYVLLTCILVDIDTAGGDRNVAMKTLGNLYCWHILVHETQVDSSDTDRNASLSSHIKKPVVDYDTICRLWYYSGLWERTLFPALDLLLLQVSIAYNIFNDMYHLHVRFSSDIIQCLSCSCNATVTAFIIFTSWSWHWQ